MSIHRRDHCHRRSNFSESRYCDHLPSTGHRSHPSLVEPESHCRRLHSSFLGDHRFHLSSTFPASYCCPSSLTFPENCRRRRYRLSSTLPYLHRCPLFLTSPEIRRRYLCSTTPERHPCSDFHLRCSHLAVEVDRRSRLAHHHLRALSTLLLHLASGTALAFDLLEKFFAVL